MRIKINTISLSLSNLLGKIDGKNILKVKKGTRTIEAINLLNDFITDEALMPDVFIDTFDVTTAKPALNLILLNLLGETNNIFLNIETSKFFTLKKDEPIPKNTMTLQRTINSKYWFKMKDQMLNSGMDDSNVQKIMDKGANVIGKLLESDFVVRENISMNTENFIKLSTL
jgi:hypothetical protein